VCATKSVMQVPFERFAIDPAVDFYATRMERDAEPARTDTVAHSAAARELVTVVLGGHAAYRSFLARKDGDANEARGRLRAAWLLAHRGMSEGTGVTIDDLLKDGVSVRAMLEQSAHDGMVPLVTTGLACVAGAQQAALADALLEPGYDASTGRWRASRILPSVKADRELDLASRHHAMHPVEPPEEPKPLAVVETLPPAARALAGGSRSLFVGRLDTGRLGRAVRHADPGLYREILKKGLGVAGKTLEDQAEALCPSFVVAAAATRPPSCAWTPRLVREARARLSLNPAERLQYQACFALLLEECRGSLAEPRSRVVVACRALEAACLLGLDADEGTVSARATCEDIVLACETPYLREEADALLSAIESLSVHLCLFGVGGMQHRTYFAATALPTAMIRRPYVHVTRAAGALVLRAKEGLGESVAVPDGDALRVRVPLHRVESPQSFEGVVQSFLASDGAVWVFREPSLWWRDGAPERAVLARAAAATARLVVLADVDDTAEEAPLPAERSSAAAADAKDALRALLDEAGKVAAATSTTPKT